MKKVTESERFLNSATARTLYHNFAESMPILDYRTHVSAKDIYEDRAYRSLTQAWIVDGFSGDAEKWRLMRRFGVPEEYITGNRSDEEKFMKFASVLSFAVGSPIYSRSCDELKRYFGITEKMTEKNAKAVYEKANGKLKDLSARKLIEMGNYRSVFTSDDPTDPLKWHVAIKNDVKMKFSVLPTFCADRAVDIGNVKVFSAWVARLAEVVGHPIKTLDDFENALLERVKFFDEVGCVSADHVIDPCFTVATRKEVAKTFKKAVRGKTLSESEIGGYKLHILTFLGGLYERCDWVQQYHVGVSRNNSTRAYNGFMTDGMGYDSADDKPFIKDVLKLLDRLDNSDMLPKTLIYAYNDNGLEDLISLCDCFRRDGVAMKVRFVCGGGFYGSEGAMRKYIDACVSSAVLSKTMGVSSDSGNLISYYKHDLFRRLFCDKLASLIESGDITDDTELIGKIIRDVCYYNAVGYFKKA